MAERPQRSAKSLEALARAQDQRSKILQRLNDEDYDNGDLIRKLEKCGEKITLVCVHCRNTHVAETRCKRKWCPVCARGIAARASSRYAAAIEEMQWPLFVTGTVKNFSTIEGDEIALLKRAFKKIRAQRWWKKRVRGGVCSIEVTNIGNGWHPHAHMVIDCRWLGITVNEPPRGATREVVKQRYKQATKEISDQWSLALGRTGSVKIKRAYREENGTNKPIGMEVLKYSVKGSDLIECAEDITPLIRLLDAGRLVVSWGTLFGKKLVESKEDRPPLECACCQGEVWVPKDSFDAAERKKRKR